MEIVRVILEVLHGDFECLHVWHENSWGEAKILDQCVKLICVSVYENILNKDKKFLKLDLVITDKRPLINFLCQRVLQFL